ncbi:hypothetical protein ACFU8W_00240 [Streptomyces sp. NPDC057565]|uniref:hypothetical protein n=1 Tax=Streptomyces sp. NPDC057565 TaxID=3346169 RepID=UPI0036CE7667
MHRTGPRHAGAARAVLGPLLPVFTDGSAGPGAAGWVAAHVPAAAGDAGMSRRAPAGTVLARAQLHGSADREAAGQFAGMGHTGNPLPATQTEMPADAFAPV